MPFISGFRQSNNPVQTVPRRDNNGIVVAWGTACVGEFILSEPPRKPGFIAQYVRIEGAVNDCATPPAQFPPLDWEYTEYFNVAQSPAGSSGPQIGPNDGMGAVLPGLTWGWIRFFAEAKYFEGEMPADAKADPNHPSGGMCFYTPGKPPEYLTLAVGDRWIRHWMIEWNFCWNNQQRQMDYTFHMKGDSIGKNPEKDIFMPIGRYLEKMHGLRDPKVAVYTTLMDQITADQSSLDCTKCKQGCIGCTEETECAMSQPSHAVSLANFRMNDLSGIPNVPSSLIANRTANRYLLDSPADETLKSTHWLRNA